jgi:hypothetical protein
MVFCFVQNIFLNNTRVRIFIFLSRETRNVVTISCSYHSNCRNLTSLTLQMVALRCILMFTYESRYQIYCFLLGRFGFHILCFCIFIRIIFLRNIINTLILLKFSLICWNKLLKSYIFLFITHVCLIKIRWSSSYLWTKQKLMFIHQSHKTCL